MNSYKLKNISTFLITFVLLVGVNTSSFAHNKVVVVPLGGDPAPLKNVIRVSAKNGDYTSIETAMAAITNANFINTYYMIVGPGEYNLTNPLRIKDGVHVVGAGADLTVIRGSFSSTPSIPAASTITVSDNASISNISVYNGGGGSANLVIGVSLEDSAKMSNVSVVVSAPNTNHDPIGVLSNNTGIANITESSIFVQGGVDAVGLFSVGSVDPGDGVIVTATQIKVETDTKAVGVKDSILGFVKISNSKIEAVAATSTGLEINHLDSRITQTEINGATAVDDQVAGTKNCLDTFNNDLSFHSC